MGVPLSFSVALIRFLLFYSLFLQGLLVVMSKYRLDFDASRYEKQSGDNDERKKSDRGGDKSMFQNYKVTLFGSFVIPSAS
jgi:hypothetical protein